MTTAGAELYHQVECRPLVGWLGLVVAHLTIGLIGEPLLLWATAGNTGLTSENTVVVGGIPLVLLQSTIVLTIAGTAVAAAVGIAAVPGSRGSRWVVTVLVVLWCVRAVPTRLADQRDLLRTGGPGGPLVGWAGWLVLGFGSVLVLVLVWRARRAAAVVAGSAAVLAAAAHLVTMALLSAYSVDAGLGAWIPLVAVVIGAGGGLCLLRTVPRRVREAPSGTSAVMVRG